MLHRAAQDFGPIRGPASGRMLGTLAGARARRLFAACAVLIATASSALAADNILSRPENCKPLLTIQKRGCEVETIYHCSVDGEDIYRSETYTEDGLDFISLSDKNHDEIIDSDPTGEFHVEADRGKSWSTPVEDVVRTGKGEAHGIGTMFVYGLSKSYRLDAQIKHEPEPINLDGKSLHLLRTSVRVEFPPPMPTFNFESDNYYDPASGVLFEGATTGGPFASEDEIPEDPASISAPGEVGFESRTPVFDCGNLSWLDLPQKESRG